MKADVAVLVVMVSLVNSRPTLDQFQPISNIFKDVLQFGNSLGQNFHLPVQGRPSDNIDEKIVGVKLPISTYFNEVESEAFNRLEEGQMDVDSRKEISKFSVFDAVPK